MENVLYIDHQESSDDTCDFDSSATPDVRVRFYRVFVGGKWVTSDPDNESQLSFNKDIHAAFEFPDYDHAKRAVDLISIESNADALILGQMYEHG